MNILLFVCFTLSLLSSQAAITHFPNSPLESFKAYLRGICTATSTNCDLSTVSSCWDDKSAAEALNMIYQSCLNVRNSNPLEASTVLKMFSTGDSGQGESVLANALHCEENLPYAHLLFEKLTMPEERNFKVLSANLIHYASARPEDTFIILKNVATAAEQGNFEAMGLLEGNFMSRASVLKKEESSDWRKNAKNGRRLMFKGFCEALGLNCPIMESLNAMDEQNSARDLQIVYEWSSAVSSKPMASGSKSNVEFFLGRGKELMDQLSKSALEADENSIEVKLINEKLGFDIWSAEWIEAIIDFANEYPELSWHYKVSEHQLLENNDLEGLGVVLGLGWYQIAEWKHGRFAQKVTVEDSDL